MSSTRQEAFPRICAQMELDRICRIGERMGNLVAQISQASQEQAQGIDQVNTAVAQMDKITQSNAAGAEESASASEEMSVQAEAVRGMVNELVAMVGATKSSAPAAGARPSAAKSRATASAATAGGTTAATTAHSGFQEADIPMDKDDSLEGF